MKGEINMKRICNYQKIIRKIAYLLECILSLIILIGVLLGSLDMLRILWESYFVNGRNMGYEEFNSFLNRLNKIIL